MQPQSSRIENASQARKQENDKPREATPADGRATLQEICLECGATTRAASILSTVAGSARGLRGGGKRWVQSPCRVCCIVVVVIVVVVVIFCW